jgi:hypothetical protein
VRRRGIDGVVVMVLAAASLLRPSPGATLGQEPATVAGWQSYTDATSGYTVAYPPGWQVRLVFENANSEPTIIRRRTAFHDADGRRIEIDVWHKAANVPLDRWFRQVENIEPGPESNAVIGGQKAFVLVQPAGCGAPTVISTYVAFADQVFKIILQYTGDQASLDVYQAMLRSFSLAGTAIQGQPSLPDISSLLPLTCKTNVCPSTCSGGCTFAPVDQGCCGYHAIPWWQCARECIGCQVGGFKGNCVWWAAYARPDVGDLAMGNAENWAVSVRNTGQLPLDRTPKVGDIVVHPGSSYNHVAYVVWVSSDGSSYRVSDMGWCGDCGPTPEEAKTYTVDADDEFIHCAGDPAIPTTDWQFTNCPFGWVPSKGFSASSLNGSAWILDPGQDPYLLSPMMSVSAIEYTYLEFTAALTAGDAEGRIYFTTASSPAFDDNKVVTFTTTGDGNWGTYVVDMSANPQWQGTITRLRLDPVEAGHGDGSPDNIAIARIRFRKSPPGPLEHRLYLPLIVRGSGGAPINQPPYVPSDPFPPDGATGQPTVLALAWSGGDPDGDAVTYDVYLDAGDDDPTTLICEDAATPDCAPGLLLGSTRYHWQAIAADGLAATAGPIWTFTTTLTTCVEAISNGGFETDSDWEIPATAYQARYVTAKAHSGSRSMQIGIVDPLAQVRSYSSIRQLVTIPADAQSATLGFWLYTLTTEPVESAAPPPDLASIEEAPLSGDAQYLLVLNQENVRIGTLLWQLQDNATWTPYEVDLLPYVGQTIKLQFGVYNDGQGGVTGMYVDDVSLPLCSP